MNQASHGCGANPFHVEQNVKFRAEPKRSWQSARVVECGVFDLCVRTLDGQKWLVPSRFYGECLRVMEVVCG
jgi:hypothetical protein